MSNYIQTNDRLVNLKNVSNINVLPKSNRIVFNMNYYIEIEKMGDYKLISDYCYWDLLSTEQLEFAVKTISDNDYFIANYITSGNASVNVNEISSVKFSDKKKRVIMNLSHPVTYTDFNGNDNITSEFVYFNYEDYSEYRDAEQQLKLTLLEGN